ncbi:MAG: thermonuclease family protein [Treponema sp.]|jgi:micrococcal nuclease|nr:thermonuclease family protein [Treponema sp.]
MKKEDAVQKFPALPSALFLILCLALSGPVAAQTSKAAETLADSTVYVTNTGKKYHREDCGSLSRSKIALSMADATGSGYEPCNVCKPPVLVVPAVSSQAAALYQVNIAGLGSVSQADLSRMTRAEVVDHVDGDTVRVRIRNPPPGLAAVETIRMIGVDTPETVHPRREVEFFGREASEFTRQKLLGNSVSLAFDWDRRDRYGRLLAYIYGSDGDCHNAVLIREGYAHAYTAYSFQFVDEFRGLEQEARRAGRGLWGRLWLEDNQY